jgi:hypothetical protein
MGRLRAISRRQLTDGPVAVDVLYVRRRFAVRFHERQGTLETLMDGSLLQQYGAFLMRRPCTPGTVVKVLGQLLNVLRFMRSPTGQGVLQPPLSVEEVPALAALEQSLSHVKRQYFALANKAKAPVRSPEELVAAGRWAFGGMPQLQQAARARAARLVATVARVRLLERPKSAQHISLARKLSGCMATMLLTALPPQRPRSLYTLRLCGVEGVQDPPNMCSVCPPGTRCRGNTLVREAPSVYRWHISHHKCERSRQIPSQEISAAASSDPVLLSLLEQVGQSNPLGPIHGPCMARVRVIKCWSGAHTWPVHGPCTGH